MLFDSWTCQRVRVWWVFKWKDYWERSWQQAATSGMWGSYYGWAAAGNVTLNHCFSQLLPIKFLSFSHSSSCPLKTVPNSRVCQVGRTVQRPTLLCSHQPWTNCCWCFAPLSLCSKSWFCPLSGCGTNASWFVDIRELVPVLWIVVFTWTWIEGCGFFILWIQIIFLLNCKLRLQVLEKYNQWYPY